ncbi:DinB family protein [Spirosoma fluminis]
MSTDYLKSVISQFEYYKWLGEKTLDQLPDDAFFWQYNEQSNSVAILIKHLWGNMLSRWTDFLTTDGEKEWRDRDEEFTPDSQSKDELRQKWDEGWRVLLETLQSLREEDLTKTIYIRNQGHTVVEAINRQLAHYSYHIGQLVFLGKMLAKNWTSLSIPRGESSQFNADKFALPKHREHFTDAYLKPGQPDEETTLN